VLHLPQQDGVFTLQFGNAIGVDFSPGDQIDNLFLGPLARSRRVHPFFEKHDNSKMEEKMREMRSV
jgi:hypothetical protein